MYESTCDITKISIKLPLILARFCQITKPISLKTNKDSGLCTFFHFCHGNCQELLSFYSLHLDAILEFEEKIELVNEDSFNQMIPYYIQVIFYLCSKYVLVPFVRFLQDAIKKKIFCSSYIFCYLLLLDYSFLLSLQDAIKKESERGVWRKDFVQLNSVGSQGNSCDGVVTMRSKFFLEWQLVYKNYSTLVDGTKKFGIPDF